MTRTTVVAANLLVFFIAYGRHAISFHKGSARGAAVSRNEAEAVLPLVQSIALGAEKLGVGFGAGDSSEDEGGENGLEMHAGEMRRSVECKYVRDKSAVHLDKWAE